MGKLFAIGEALIDFMPSEAGKGIGEVESFMPAVGGAPANVCGAFAKLGGESALITQLGDDAFGDKIVSELQQWKIDCSYVKRTDKAATSLAFVALKENGDREFFFCRKPGADMLFSEEDIEAAWFEEGDMLHFCSVSLGDFPMKEAHKKAISYAKEKGMLISFDPNLRPALWTDQSAMITTVREFLTYADVVKISDEEMSQVTGKDTIEEAVAYLFQKNVKLVIYTKGEKGAEAYTREASAGVSGITVECVDTTGAGDGFIGSFLYCLCKDGIGAEELSKVSAEKLREYLTFANWFASRSVMKKGAIISYPSGGEYTEEIG